MKHYGISQWVDFARGVAEEGTAAAMRKHLGGCDNCRAVSEFCTKLTRVCEGMVLEPAPGSAVRVAKAAFPVRAPLPRHSLRLPVELIYDSFLMPAIAGLRANWQVGWQGLYRAGDCTLDLRIDPDLHSGRLALIGQIFNKRMPDIQMGDIPVFLKSGKVVVAEAVSNRFGEFHMEYEPQARLQLSIYLDGGSKLIQVPVKRMAPEADRHARIKAAWKTCKQVEE